MRKFSAHDLKLLRLARGIKQKEIARLLKISVQRYSELENNEARPQNRTDEIITALGYTIESASKALAAMLQ